MIHQISKSEEYKDLSFSVKPVKGIGSGNNEVTIPLAIILLKNGSFLELKIEGWQYLDYCLLFVSIHLEDPRVALLPCHPANKGGRHSNMCSKLLLLYKKTRIIELRI